ncbi:MAG: serine/threonine protein kinase [Actinomycetia bacterium]|nr:serine/threonine protein kinase [Actinomycetes bacterium]
MYDARCGIMFAGRQGRPATAIVAPRTRAVGTTVGPFHLDQFLGGGHDTEVWRADGDGIIVAVKLLRPEADALARARLAREAAVLSSIDHPAIGGLLAAGEEDGEPFLAFTLYEAGTLAAGIDRGHLAVAEAAAVFGPVAGALAYVHERGVVHRDVKPANVLCTRDGPVLIDFSIASVTGSTYDGWIEGAPAVAGTEGYRAPEAGTREPAPAEDVYALGVSLLEAITGMRTLDASSEPEVALGPLQSLVESCMARDPAARPSAAALVPALRTIANGVSAPVEPPPRDTPNHAVAVPATERTSARKDELARLANVADEGVRAGELRAVLVLAPAGAGKTWLMQHAATRVLAARPDRKVLAARCSEAAGDATILRPWLRPLLERDADPVDTLARVVGRAPATQVARALGIVHSGTVEGDPGVVADALAALLASMGEVVCVVEDLHHASLELLDLLSRLALRPGVPGALWGTTRPGFVDPDDLDFETLVLAPLDDDAISALVMDEIGVAAGGVIADVVAVAGGNPLHAREAALAALRGEARGTSTALSSLPELIADRFEHLDRKTRDALEIAAACGDSFWPEAVGNGLLAGSAALYYAGVAQVRMTSSIVGSTEAGWAHPLLQEVAYERLAPTRRRELHARLGSVLDNAGALSDVVARQAGTAFRLGDVASAPLAGRSAAAAARDALDRFALSGAASWIGLLRDTGHEPVSGVADVLDAELRIARGEFDAAARLVRPLTVRDDDIGVRALVLATEATAGVGDLLAAEQFGERARTRMGDDPELALTFGVVLALRGRLEDALELLDAATARSKDQGDDAFAARLAAQAADVAADLAQRDALPFAPAIQRTRDALEALRQAGDRRHYAESVDALFGMVNIDHPHEALELAKEAAEIARSLGDGVAYGRAVYRVCDGALDLCDVETFQGSREDLVNAPLTESMRVAAGFLIDTFDALHSGDVAGAPTQLLSYTARFRAVANADAFQPIFLAISAALWQGKVELARSLLRSHEADELPPVFRTIAELNLRALGGSPWTEAGIDLPHSTSAHNERALLRFLNGEALQANQLLVERHAQCVERAGHAFQRFAPCFAGALVAALGPAETEPAVEWLRTWVVEPPLPGLWVVHRAIAALLLAERDHDRGLALSAMELLDRVDPDEGVRAWITSRARQLL